MIVITKNEWNDRVHIFFPALNNLFDVKSITTVLFIWMRSHKIEKISITVVDDLRT